MFTPQALLVFFDSPIPIATIASLLRPKIQDFWSANGLLDDPVLKHLVARAGSPTHIIFKILQTTIQLCKPSNLILL